MIRNSMKNYVSSLPGKECIEKSIFELSKQRGLIPEENNENKEKELFDECSYFIQNIEKVINDSVKNKKERNNIYLDKNKIKHLKYTNFEKCIEYKDLQKSLKNIGIDMYVYKSNHQLNMIEYKLLDKKVEIYH